FLLLRGLLHQPQPAQLPRDLRPHRLIDYPGGKETVGNKRSAYISFASKVGDGTHQFPFVIGAPKLIKKLLCRQKNQAGYVIAIALYSCASIATANTSCSQENMRQLVKKRKRSSCGGILVINHNKRCLIVRKRNPSEHLHGNVGMMAP